MLFLQCDTRVAMFYFQREQVACHQSEVFCLLGNLPAQDPA